MERLSSSSQSWITFRVSAAERESLSDTDVAKGDSKRQESKKFEGRSKTERYRFSCGTVVAVVLLLGGSVAMVARFSSRDSLLFNFLVTKGDFSFSSVG